jgi:hypothetical protein
LPDGGRDREVPTNAAAKLATATAGGPFHPNCALILGRLGSRVAAIYESAMRTKLKFYLLIILGIFALISSGFVAWIRFFLTPWLAEDSLSVLNKYYGPNHDPQFGYKGLYDYATQITQHRNSQACFYQSIICVLLVLLGGILLLWCRDYKKTYGKRP